MQATLAELAALVDGRLVGDGNLVIQGAAPLCNARPGQITLLDGCVDRLPRLDPTRISAVLASPSPPCRMGFRRSWSTRSTRRLRRSSGTSTRRGADAAPASARWPSSAPRPILADDVDVHPHATDRRRRARSASGSTIHSGVHIMAGSKIGRDVTIFPNVVLYENTVVGDRCILHAGAVLGRLRLRLLAGRRPARPFGPVGQRHPRRRRRGRRRHDDRPRDLRPDDDRRGHQDRRPRDDRPQLPHRTTQHALLPGRHRRQHDHRRLRRHGRPGGRARPRPHRQSGACWAPWPA